MTAAEGALETRFRLRLGAAALALALWAAALAHFGPGARGVIGGVFCAAVILFAGIDVERRRIPDRVALPAIGVVLVAQLVAFPGAALEWIGAGAAACLLFAVPRLFKRELVGAGEVRLAALLGVGLGDDVLLALFIGSLAAVPWALYIVAARGATGRGEVIPLGPFLALGGILALFLGELPG